MGRGGLQLILKIIIFLIVCALIPPMAAAAAYVGVYLPDFAPRRGAKR